MKTITSKAQLTKATLTDNLFVCTRSEAGKPTELVKRSLFGYTVMSFTRGEAPTIEAYSTLAELKNKIIICHW